MKTIYLIVGRSGAGKDSVVNGLVNMGYSQVISYATRPKRVNEKNTHIFITNEEVDDYIDDMCAYTQIGEYQYFATYKQLYENDLYIIDPAGVKSLRSKLEKDIANGKEDIRLITIYIYVPDKIRLQRILNIRKDDIEIVQKRMEAEDKEFTEFENNTDYDYIILNIDLQKSIELVARIIESYKNK